MKKTTDFIKLVSSAKDGNKKAFDKLYSLTCKDVWFSCVSLMKNKENAEDIFQETYLTAFEKIGTLEDNENFLCWIKRIAVNKCKDFLKTKVEYQLEDEYIKDVEETDEVFIPEEYVTSNEKRKIIVQLMEEALTYVQYQTVFMYYFSNMTVADISEVMECSEGTVKSRLSFARAKMKTAITNYEEENDDKLHAIVPIPFFEALFRAESENMEVPQTSIKVPTKNGTKVISNISNALLSTTKAKVIAGACVLVFLSGIATAAIFLTTGCWTSNVDKISTGDEFNDLQEATVYVEETIPEDEASAIKDAELKVDENGKITDEKGNTYESDEKGNVKIKTKDGKEVTTSVDTVNAVNNDEKTVYKPTTVSEANKDTSSKSDDKKTYHEAVTKKVWVAPEYKNETKKVWVEPTTKKVWVKPVTEKVWVDKTTKKVWVKPETKTEKVWVEPVTHTEPVYEKQIVYICNDCGADVTDLIKRLNSGEDIPPEKHHIYQHAINGGKGSWHSEYKDVQVGTKTVTDKEGYWKTKTVTVKEGYYKTVTDKEGHYENKVVKEGYYKTVPDKEGYYKNETVKVKVSDGYWKTVTVKEAGWY